MVLQLSVIYKLKYSAAAEKHLENKAIKNKWKATTLAKII